MSDQQIENIEIEPLSDSDLEEVAGGVIAEEDVVVCSRDNCSNG
jgi:hypothetical protein